MLDDVKYKEKNWRNYLWGGFANMDASSSSMDLDEVSIKRMFFAAMRENVSMDEIKKVIQEYLEGHEWNSAAISSQIKCVERFVKSIKPTKKKKTAWLIRWETMGESLPYDNQIIAIRDGRTSLEKIKEYVEQYYISRHSTLVEKMHYSSYPKDNPYPAQYVMSLNDGCRLAGMTCGHSPFIFASYVKNLKIYTDAEDGAILSWDKVKIN